MMRTMSFHGLRRGALAGSAAAMLALRAAAQRKSVDEAGEDVNDKAVVRILFVRPPT
jgi:hypothetical protein